MLTAYRAKDFLKLTENAESISKVDTDFMIRVLDNITIYESGNIIISFYDGTKIEYIWFNWPDALICGRSFWVMYIAA